MISMNKTHPIVIPMAVPIGNGLGMFTVSRFVLKFPHKLVTLIPILQFKDKKYKYLT